MKRILLTGATGYIGGRLLPRLEAGGHRVRCLARLPERLRGRVAPQTEVVAGDVLDPATLDPALHGIDTAFYLIHSMGDAGGFEEKERRAARNFAAAARRAGVRKIIYLGGLGNDTDLSPHLSSRQDVGRILRESGVPTVEFRASIIIGSGSLSFEMVRALVNKLPVMITPRWVKTPAQPIAVEDVIRYLLATLEMPLQDSAVYDIGGAETVSYRDLMAEYARQRGLRRLFVPVPVLTPRLSSLWLGLITPLYARIGRKLIDSIRHPTVADDRRARAMFGVRPLGLSDAIARALANESRELAATRWSDALSSAGQVKAWGGVRFGSRLVDSRTIDVRVSPRQAFAPIQRIGGTTGWYFGNWLWRLRGFIDLLVGGVGLRRGRRHPVELHPGDAVDFWRVREIRPHHLLRLAAEMKLPGRAWLQFEVDATPDGSRIRQTAIFEPIGLSGLAYWYGIYPLHALVFRKMIEGIGRAAAEATADPTAMPAAEPGDGALTSRM
ncbi:MAG: SDR family oxidoreductase [Acidobacteriota bacterium]|jgi:uncharacterized protein YbjT (DUF2867 family)